MQRLDVDNTRQTLRAGLGGMGYREAAAKISKDGRR